MNFVNYSKLGFHRGKVQTPKPSRIFLFPRPLQMRTPYHPYSHSSLGFLPLFPLSSITFMFLIISLFHICFSLQIPFLFSCFILFKQALSACCMGISGAMRAQKSALAFNPYTWQQCGATKLHEILLSFHVSKAHWILWKLKWEPFS